MKLKRTMHQVFAIARTDFLGIARNKTAIFFTLLFPLFFLIIIGFTFGTQSTSETSRVHIGIVNLDGKMINVNGTISENSTIGDAFVQNLKDANFTVYEYSAYGDKNTNGTAAYISAEGKSKLPWLYLPISQKHSLINTQTSQECQFQQKPALNFIPTQAIPQAP